jgi:hypothetical protein
MTVPPSTERAVAAPDTERGQHKSTTPRAATAFDSLLKVTDATRMGVAVSAGDMPEAQMFEAPVPEGEKDANQKADGGGRTSMADRIVEQNDNHTGVRARRAARNAEARQVRGPIGEGTGQRRGVSSHLKGLSGRRVAGRIGNETGRIPLADPGRSDAGRETARLTMTKAPQASAANGTSSAKADLGTSSSDLARGAARAVAGATPVAPVKTATAPGEGMARQVGQILAGGKGGEVESPRAVPSGPDVSDGAKGQSRQKATGSAKPDQAETGRGTARGKEAEGSSRSTFERLVRAIRLTNGPYRSSARLRLDPPELGRMNVEVRLQGDRLQIDVAVQTREARELLHDRLADLRTALEHHGLRVERFDISVNVREEAEFTSPQDRGSDQGTHARGDGGPSRSQAGASATPAEMPPEGEAVTQEVEWEAGVESRLDIRV